MLGPTLHLNFDLRSWFQKFCTLYFNFICWFLGLWSSSVDKWTFSPFSSFQISAPLFLGLWSSFIFLHRFWLWSLIFVLILFTDSDLCIRDTKTSSPDLYAQIKYRRFKMLSYARNRWAVLRKFSQALSCTVQVLSGSTFEPCFTPLVLDFWTFGSSFVCFLDTVQYYFCVFEFCTSGSSSVVLWWEELNFVC